MMFWRRLAVVYGVGGLGEGLLPLQMTNSLVELGMVQPARLTTMSEFAAQPSILGADSAIFSMGFPSNNPSLTALAFRVTYKHVHGLLVSLGHNFEKGRYDPADHEHILCKVSRTQSLLEQAHRDKNSLERWAHRWSPDQVVQIDPDLVKTELELMRGAPLFHVLLTSHVEKLQRNIVNEPSCSLGETCVRYRIQSV
jgi:hypothetical protein